MWVIGRVTKRRSRNCHSSRTFFFFSFSYGCTRRKTLMKYKKEEERKRPGTRPECGSQSFLRAGFPPLCSIASSASIPPRKPHAFSSFHRAGINTCRRCRLTVIPQTGATEASAPQAAKNNNNLFELFYQTTSRSRYYFHFSLCFRQLFIRYLGLEMSKL